MVQVVLVVVVFKISAKKKKNGRDVHVNKGIKHPYRAIF